MIDRVVDGEWQLAIAAVDRGRAGVDQMLEIRQPAAGFQHHEFAHNVSVDIGVGVFQRIAHPGLCRHMNDPVDLWLPVDQFEHRLTV